MLEREIKLRFATAAEAREAVARIAATPVRDRRLQDDFLLDTPDGLLQGQRATLRVRVESGRGFLTFKGPVQPGLVKLREELETAVDDGALVLSMFQAMGFRVWFRYQKYREEYATGEVTIAIDETPIGTFVEIEGTERGIEDVAAAFGRGLQDRVLDSYRGLFVRHCEQRGLVLSDMLFEG